MSNVPAAPAQTGIHLNTSFFPLAFMLYFFKAEASLDGGPKAVVGWGDAWLPAAPGQHRLDVSIPYFIGGDVGKAAGMIDVPAQGAAVVKYKAPVWLIFMDGKLIVEGAGQAALPQGQPQVQPVAQPQPQAQPVAQAQPAPPPQAAAPQPQAPAPAGGPQWDAQRNAYVQWDPAQQGWFQFDNATQQWRPIS